MRRYSSGHKRALEVNRKFHCLKPRIKMKTLIAIVIILFFYQLSFAQKIKESQVPPSVMAALQKMNLGAKSYTWYLEDGNYEAEYKVNQMEQSVSFDKNGNLVETEKEIPIKDLPAGIADYVAKNYSGATIKEASEITDVK